MTTGCLASDIILIAIIYGAWKLCLEILIGIKAEQTKHYCKKEIDESIKKIMGGKK